MLGGAVGQFLRATPPARRAARPGGVRDGRDGRVLRRGLEDPAGLDRDGLRDDRPLQAARPLDARLRPERGPLAALDALRGAGPQPDRQPGAPGGLRHRRARTAQGRPGPRPVRGPRAGPATTPRSTRSCAGWPTRPRPSSPSSTPRAGSPGSSRCGTCGSALLGSNLGPLVLAADLATRPVLTVTPRDDLHTALRRLTERNLDEIPVVAPDDPTRLLGLLSRRELVSAYTNQIASLRQPAPAASGSVE